MLEIIRIHNELMGTYGDRGNADILKFRASIAGIRSSVTDISYSQVIPRTGDIYLLGGAEDAAQVLSHAALAKSKALNSAVAKGAVVLAVCAGFQIIGNSFVANDERYSGLGLLDVQTSAGKKRLVGDIAIESEFFDANLTGFENHSGITTLGKSVMPLGKVIVGNGNGAGDVDGAVFGNVFGTYLHGPVLARNPEFADLLLERAAGEPIKVVRDELADRYAKWRRAAIK
jgi:CobQ-like glutamine amidotransferase family enzyme